MWLPSWPPSREIERNVFVEPSRINSTFGGNMSDILRFKLILEIIEQDNLAQNANEVGKYLLQKLRVLEQNYEGIISNTRGLGLMCAFDLPTKEKRDAFIGKARENGLLILACGDNSIRFRPHLVVTKQEIDLGIGIIEKLLIY